MTWNRIVRAGMAAVLLAGCGPDADEIAARAPSSETFHQAVDAVLPAVVYIQIEARPVSLQGLFGQIPEGGPERHPPEGAGSGIIVSDDGYILTSDHVVQQADRVSVMLHDRRQFEARVVARDPSTDVAVLKIDAEGLPVARLGDSDRLALGDWVLALGSPLGLQFSVTAGVVSATGRAIGILNGQQRTAPLEHFIQTDAAINPGNSGGPLVNLAGEVVGINTAIASPTGFFAGYGFAVPINLARRVAAQLIEHGHVRRAYLGLLLNNVDAADAKVYGLEAAQGAEVVSIEPVSPAAKSGIRLGDVIVGIADKPVATVSDLQAALATLEPGSTVPVEVIRYGAAVRVPVELGLIRSGVQPEPPPVEGPTRVGFAVAVEDGKMVVASVRPYSTAARAGVRPGQVVVAVNRRAVRSIEDLVDAVNESGRDVVSLEVVDPEYGRMIINYELRS
ncbi:MAG TPA: trypsin-like peptidase domain-containing protein [Longimicrobiales bacterium]